MVVDVFVLPSLPPIFGTDGASLPALPVCSRLSCTALALTTTLHLSCVLSGVLLKAILQFPLREGVKWIVVLSCSKSEP